MCFLPASSQPPPLKWLNDSRGHFHTHTCCWAQNQFGEFQAVSLPEAITAIFHSPSAAHQCETRTGLFSADASAVLLFDQGFVRHILLVSPGAVGMNEKWACEKVGSQMEKEKEKRKPSQNISLLRWPGWYFVIFGMFPWIIHAWLVTTKKTAGVTVCFQNLEFIKDALFIQ